MGHQTHTHTHTHAHTHTLLPHVEDGLAALGTVGGEQREVVGLAVRTAILLEEIPAAELRLALTAHKVLRVPDLPQGCHHLGIGDGDINNNIIHHIYIATQPPSPGQSASGERGDIYNIHIIHNYI